VQLQDLANLAASVSSVAVILSLIYLAIQVRQNTASIRTETFARALERVSAMQSVLFENGDLARLQAQGVLDPSKLTREERLQLTWWLSEAFGAFEFMFRTRSGTDGRPPLPGGFRSPGCRPGGTRDRLHSPQALPRS